MEKYCCKNEEAEKTIEDLKEKDKTKKFDENFIRELIAKQKGALSVESKYYKGKNIAEGNWSLVEDEEIEKLDEKKVDDEIVDIEEIIYGKKSIRREKDAEYQYVFIPSYYAIKILIKYYLMNKTSADKIYNLKNAVVMRKDKKFYGGLPFVLRYLNKISKDCSEKDLRCDFAEIMEELISRKNGLKMNNCKDEFINDIIDCIKVSKCASFVLEKRIIDFEKNKEKYYCIDFKEDEKYYCTNAKENVNYMQTNEIQNDYKILAHREVEKDWDSLKKAQKDKAHEEIRNTPNYPKNEPPKNEHLNGDLKGWFSQRISKKDRLVYKIDPEKKIVYIATVCDHYKDAFRRSKSIESYKKMNFK